MKTVEHIVENGSRNHVLWWDAFGTHCSVDNCEINQSPPTIPKPAIAAKVIVERVNDILSVSDTVRKDDD